jgi:hypothetical protein
MIGLVIRQFFIFGRNGSWIILWILKKRSLVLIPFAANRSVVIQAVLDGHSALAVFPTGGGKSLCCQSFTSKTKAVQSPDRSAAQDADIDTLHNHDRIHVPDKKLQDAEHL